MFDQVLEFEKAIAGFFGSRFAVAVDSCTHAIELCLRYRDHKTAVVPAHTYISVPFTMLKLGIPVRWSNDAWQGHYQIGGTDVIDAAAFWQPGGYVVGSLMCLSFQHKKHLKLGRGGAILCDSLQDYEILKKMSYDGRDLSLPWADQDIKTVGYHYYMTPETATLGLEEFERVRDQPARTWSWQDYPDLRNMSVFQ